PVAPGERTPLHKVLLIAGRGAAVAHDHIARLRGLAPCLDTLARDDRDDHLADHRRPGVDRFRLARDSNPALPPCLGEQLVHVAALTLRRTHPSVPRRPPTTTRSFQPRDSRRQRPTPSGGPPSTPGFRP